MIRIDLIPILNAINNEYGIDELIKRLKKILNIDLSELLKQPKSIIFQRNSITITNETTGVKHTLTFQEEYYTHRKDYVSYFITNYYDMSKKEIRKVAVFKTTDSDLLIIDEINEENIVTRRIAKTIAEDTDFINGSFEKEILFYQSNQARETYEYTEDLFCNKKVSKQLEMPGNLYAYSFRSIVNATTNKYQCGYIESSMCTNKPQVLVAGRVRDKNELLISSIKTPLPNILIRGRNIIPGVEQDVELYNINIYKSSNNIQITFNNFSISTCIPEKKEEILASATPGEITPPDIDLIIEHIMRMVDLTIANEIKKDLINLRQKILVTKNRTLKESDFFEEKLLQFGQFEQLVFDVYTNLPTYEEMINKSTTPDKGEKPPTLRKI